MSDRDGQYSGSEIAIIGIGCRFPEADDAEAFWQNLRQGRECLSELSDEQLAAAGVDPAISARPDYVRRVPRLDRVEWFDAEFFGYTPAEARLIDPQQRLFMECAWEALERAGYDPSRGGGPVGVFTGAKTNTYLFNLIRNRQLLANLDTFQLALGNDLAAMATRLSFKLDLRGPSYAIHTACSTSLVAVHLACQSLLIDECRMAIAGGAAINVPQDRGYLHQPGGILSPDGSCRTFSAEAAGSNFGNGVGAVLLKRLEDAIADGDHVHAVIKGSATNNDGAGKASFTAPGVAGQTAVILEAMAVAGVDAETISYVEAHGTATDLGDSIEVLALTEAFRASSARNGFCALGSAKTNLGHLETAAGVAGLIKAALALEAEELPPSLHFSAPSANIDFDGSPFRVQAELAAWPRGEAPRRAGVSSFGIGSTNAHVVLEEAPPAPPTSPSRPWQVLLLSARSETALDAATANLARRLEERPDLELADVAYTLQVGRRRFSRRRAIVCRDRDEALAALAGEVADGDGGPRRLDHREEAAARPVAFLFPGLGEQYPGMARGLYRDEPAFRRAADRCAELFAPHLDVDLRTLLFAGEAAEGGGARLDLKRMLGRGGGRRAAGELHRTRIAQPATFLVEHALAELWASWGVRPKAMIGYSLGEYVAAERAGVFSLEDACALVAERARMIDELPAGAMLAVPLGEDEVTPLLGEELSIAAVNGPALVVVAGGLEAVAALEERLAARGTVCRRLETTHAFHSAAMEPLRERWAERVAAVERRAPQVPFVSNVTGTWIRPEEATDPAYWAAHMCRPVRFFAGAGELLAGAERLLLEVGPGQGLGSFLKLHPQCGAEQAARVLPSLPGAFDAQPDQALLLTTLARLWLAGADVDWAGFSGEERRRRVVLPTYPFERQRHWVDPDLEEGAAQPAAAPAARRVTLDKQPEMADWFYRPAWRAEEAAASMAAEAEGAWLVFAEAAGEGVAAAAARRLRELGAVVFEVLPGEALGEVPGRGFALPPGDAAAYGELLSRLAAAGTPPARVLHGWLATPPEAGDAGGGAGTLDPAGTAFAAAQEHGFYSLLFLAQALGRRAGGGRVEVLVATSGLFRVAGDEALAPERATVLGPCRVIPQELPGVGCRCVDLVVPDAGSAAEAALVERLIAEAAAGGDGATVVALRGDERWVEDFERLPLDAPEPAVGLREGGVYVLTGGLGGLGLTLAEHLARRVGAKLVLTRRSPVPPREDWRALVESRPDDDADAALARRLLALEEAGGEVLALSADAADAAAMAAVRQAALDRFGAVHGVVHLAGVPGGGLIQLKSRAMAQRILAPKVAGALVAERVFASDDLDFLVLFASIASLLGEFGQVDYCGANAFLDALAQSRRGAAGPRVQVIDWDIWRDVGLAVHTEVPEHLKAWRREMLEQAILPAEGVLAFERALASGAPQVVVSAQPFHGRIELGRSFTGESFLAELGKAAGTAPVTAEAAGSTVGSRFVAAGSELEQRIAAVWQRVLGLPRVGVHDNFFDLGGNSLIGLQLAAELSRELGEPVVPVTLFESPSVAALARALAPQPGATAAAGEQLSERRRRLRGAGGADADDRRIAVVGMAARLPGADDVETFWRNLAGGVESITFFSDEDLDAAGIDRELYRDPRYVRAGAVLDGIEEFDAGLFGYSPREAEVMDPQHRLFLECAWEALERAGYDSETYPGSIGVFAGSNLSTYLLQLYADPEVHASINTLQAILGNDKDSLTTTVSYKLNLRGPSVAVQTFCSTSLVAVHMAMQSLRNGECDVALAGGIRVVTPQRQGYLYEDGGIAPADGHARSFDAKGDGSVLGNGVGLVVLKRLSDARADGDPIHAVLLGSGINNDGSLKAGYTAPSVAGQADAVAAAYEDAGVDPATVSYVEAHGSATELGDPIEVAALSRAFRRWTDRKGFCALGTVKSNFGHLDRAAGVAGLIKTVLALGERQLPPSLNFDEPNPAIDFAASPFVVQTELSPWAAGDGPRRAGVNSLGMGGTNVHVVVEEAPPPPPQEPSRPWKLLVLSAKTESALESSTARLREHFERHPEGDVADAAWTLQTGRRALEHRRIAVCRDAADAVAALGTESPRRSPRGFAPPGQRDVAFLFPGLGGQHVGMGRGLYDSEPVFRQVIDRCADLAAGDLGVDLRQVMWPARDAPERGGSDGAEGGTAGLDLKGLLGRGGAGDGAEAGGGALDRTLYAQPALFAVEVALARLLGEWGIVPRAMIGYSLGEYVAATVAGVLTLEESLSVVVARARLIEALPPGALLAVALPAAALADRLGGEVSLMAINAPEQCVVAGPAAAVEAWAAELAEQGVSCRRLPTTHAFHSAMMEPIRDEVVDLARSLAPRPPQIPYLSNVTGTWITDEEATDPEYWARHLCEPVQFAPGLAELASGPGRVLVEVGPGGALTSLVHQQDWEGDPPPAVAAMRHAWERSDDLAFTLGALGRLWLAGAAVDWPGLHLHERRRRVVLPTYPFERRRYWISTRDPRRLGVAPAAVPDADGVSRLSAVSWRRRLRPVAPADERRYLVVGRGEAAAELIAELVRRGAAAELLPSPAESLAAALGESLAAFAPTDLVDLRPLALDAAPAAETMALAEALAVVPAAAAPPRRLWLVGRALCDVDGDEPIEPPAGVLLGVARALAGRHPDLACSVVDVPAPKGDGATVAPALATELGAAASEPLVALRGNHRWVPSLESVEPSPRPPAGGAWLITGGLGEVGLAFARSLAAGGSPLALVVPEGFPERADWDGWRAGGAGTVSRGIERLQALEAAGREVVVLCSDLADAEAAGGAVAEAESRLGPLAGWLHAADPEAQDAAGEVFPSAAEVAAAIDREAMAAVSVAAALADRGSVEALLVSPAASPAAGLPAEAAGPVLDLLAADAQRRGQRWTSVAWEPSAPEANADLLARLGGLDGAAQAVVAGRRLPEAWQRATARPAAPAVDPEATAVGYYPRPELRVEYVAPENPTERAIAAVWQDLLGVERVGLHDQFLDLGGDSLLASRLVTRLRQELSLDLPIRLLFEASTVAELASEVERRRRAATQVEVGDLMAAIQGMNDEELEAEIERRQGALDEEAET